MATKIHDSYLLHLNGVSAPSLSSKLCAGIVVILAMMRATMLLNSWVTMHVVYFMGDILTVYS